MAQIYNPWMTPPETGTLTGEFASPALNGMEDTEGGEAPEAENNAMAQALAVIQQQSSIISQLLATLKPNGTSTE